MIAHGVSSAYGSGRLFKRMLNCGMVGARIARIVLLLGVLVCYAPAVIHEYGICDDFPTLLEAGRPNSLLIPANISLGRPLTGWLLNESYSVTHTIANLRYLRAAGIVGIMLLAWLIQRRLIGCLRRSPMDAALIALLIVTLPPFAIYAGWAQVWTYSFVAALTFASYTCFERGRWWEIGGGVALALVCLSIYQPAAMFFWFWVAVDLLACVGIRALSRIVVPFSAAMLWYFVAFRLTGMQSNRAALSSDFIRKARWYFREALAPSFSLQFPEAFQTLLPWFVFGCIVLFLCFDAARMSDTRGFLEQMGAWLGGFILLLVLSYLPNLVTAEYFSSYRTRASLTAIVALFLWVGFSDLLRRFRTPVFAVAAAVCLWQTNSALRSELIAPRVAELRTLRDHLRLWDPAAPKPIVIVQEPPPVLNAVDYDREFGGPTFAMPIEWNVGRSMAVVCFREIFPQAHANFSVVDHAHAGSVSANAIVIDWNRIGR
jgi:hypothetical protein